MSKLCEVCGRGTTVGYNVSHSKVRTKKTQKVNLQHKKIAGKKMRICTSCIKTHNKKAEK